jgi:HPt (histidine-containing phosphotransfer) domain-containing protein
MDDYVAKPVRAEALDAVIGRVLLDRDVQPPTPPPRAAPGDGAALDLEGVMEIFDDDAALLSGSVATFLDAAPGWVDQIASAVRSSDGKALESSAHMLKGCARNFCARDVVDAAQKLEDAGRTGRWGDAESNLALLRTELRRLEGALQDLASRPPTSGP